jgi:hypothetical protein
MQIERSTPADNSAQPLAILGILGWSHTTSGDHEGPEGRAKQWLEHAASEVPPKVVAPVIASILV